MLSANSHSSVAHPHLHLLGCQSDGNRRGRAGTGANPGSDSQAHAPQGHGSHEHVLTHHHCDRQGNRHIQGHGLVALPLSSSSISGAQTISQVARLRTLVQDSSPLTRARSAPPPALVFSRQPTVTDTATPADHGHLRQPPKKKLRPSHQLTLSVATPSASADVFHYPVVQVPRVIQVTANYDVDAFARLAVGARSGYATRPPVVDARLAAVAAASSTTAMMGVDRRGQAQAVRRMRERAVERASVVQWLVHLNAIHASFRFAPETIYTGVQYMDRALASSATARKHLAPRKPHLYLLAVVCLTLAAKFAEEYAAPSVAGILAALAAVPPPPPSATSASAASPAAQAMVQVMPAWTQKHVLAMERKVLEALHFDLAAVAPSAAVFELLFANVDLAVELCALVMSGGQSAAIASPAVGSPGSSPMATSPASSGASVFMSPGASPRSIASSTSSAGMVPPSPVSPTGAFGQEVFMASHVQHNPQQQQNQAARSSFCAAAAARPFPPPMAPPAPGAPLSAAQATWTLYSAPAPTTHADQDHRHDNHMDTAAGDLSPMDVDPSPDSTTAHDHMCMMTPPHTPPRASAAATAATPPTPSDERWPAALSSPAHRNLIARLVRAVQTELVQRVLVHAQGTAHAPLNTAVVLLNRAVVCLAAANKAAAAVSAVHSSSTGSGLDPSPMATPGATGTVTVAGTGAAVAQVAGIVSRVECVATEERGRREWGACVEMVRQAVGGQVVGLAA